MPARKPVKPRKMNDFDKAAIHPDIPGKRKDALLITMQTLRRRTDAIRKRIMKK